MVMNGGYIEGTNSDVTVRIYYDNTIPPEQDQPLINGPRGWCFDITNTSGRNRKVTMTRPNGTEFVINVGQGDPVTTGPANGRSRTAADLNALGYVLRSDVTGFSGPE